MIRLLSQCNKVFVDQATAWMVHGLLLDPHKEFLIGENTPAATNTNLITDSTSTNPQNNNETTKISSYSSTSDQQFSLRYNMIPG